MNVALYVRIGTAAQDVSMQHDELRAYCGRCDLKVVGEYQDTMSGTKDSRPALQRLLADARARKFDAIIVWKIDRFGRSLRHLVNTLAEEALGVAIISLKDPLDFTTPSGKLQFHVLAAVAEFERSLITERVRMSTARRSNLPHNGNTVRFLARSKRENLYPISPRVALRCQTKRLLRAYLPAHYNAPKGAILWIVASFLASQQL